jgi:hypothetical protein
MTARRKFLGDAVALAAGALLPLPGAAQAYGVVQELSGEVFLNGYRMASNSALRVGHTVTTGRDGRIWFTVGGDAYFLRPGSELRLQSSEPPDTLIDVLRLVTGALGATFSRGARRAVIARTATIGIRGTGIYVEATPEETYACTCFGSTELRSTTTGTMMESIPLTTERHVARRIRRDGVTPAPFERHTNEEMARLERLAGRPYPF